MRASLGTCGFKETVLVYVIKNKSLDEMKNAI